MTQPASRRDRVRAATVLEIKKTARRMLVEHGVDAMTLRAIAREMGMTAPALYRYFDSREELFNHVCADLLAELTGEVGGAIATVGGRPLSDRLAAASWGFRQWALTNPREFQVLFSERAEDHTHDDVVGFGIQSCATTFMMLFQELWRDRQFPVLPDDQIDAGLRGQLAAYGARLGTPLPAGALLVFLTCWTRLYGMVSLEVLGHLRFALDDAEPMFGMLLTETLHMLGLEPPTIGPEAMRRPGHPRRDTDVPR